MTVVSFLLTIAALAYTFTITLQTSNQHIDLHYPGLVPPINGTGNRIDKTPIRYTLDTWTPQTWYPALLELNQTDEGTITAGTLVNRLVFMYGWQYNLIPMLVLQLPITVLAWRFYSDVRKQQHVILDANLKV